METRLLTSELQAKKRLSSYNDKTDQPLLIMVSSISGGRFIFSLLRFMVEIKTIGDSLYWSYSNLAMAHAAVSSGVTSYSRTHFMIRSRLFKGLKGGTMSVGSFVDDERLKLILPRACCYCGAHNSLSVDHLIPQKRSGADSADNLVWSCKPCNSSKGSSDVIQWLRRRNNFPPLLLLRRYLKLSINYSSVNGLMDALVEEDFSVPFSRASIPHNYPQPSELVLWIIRLDDQGLDN